MLKKATIVVPKYLQKNNIFNIELHRDNIVDPYVKLKKSFKEHGYDLSTQDMNNIDKSNIIIYTGMPKILPLKDNIKNSYLIIGESPFIKPEYYDLKKHQFFNKIFTWNEDLVDNKKYFKLNYSHLFPEKINKDLTKKEKLCVLISGNKKPPHTNKGDLYSKRFEAIKWFEKKHPDEFSLYGVGWNKLKFTGPKLIRAFNRITIIGKFFAYINNEIFKTYKGQVEHKKEIMEKYKFSICYENATGFPGYVTEKIFDSFFAGCVPIYWGPDNILDYVQENCFIDKRKFKTYEDLYNFIKNIKDDQYLEYLNNIEKYLNSKQAYQFTSEYYAETLTNEILKK